MGELIIRIALEMAAQKEADAIRNLLEPNKFLANGKQRCCVGDCDREARTKGKCSLHYQRVRYGRDMDTPIHRRWRVGDRTCVDCGKPTMSNGGWNRCQPHYLNRRRRVFKEAMVELFGGACNDCGGVFPLAVYDFHHVRSGKELRTGVMPAGGAISTIAKEISKCVMLCANCHRIEHRER